ncbi:hypothetical protein F53441_5378 [Fusarium austroafricanum]|uniref:Uncharacterized protein n=1 Tax=Fusarium austroafricanum TaxID=2364996 RepID=A0A8H4KL76_9HYPO|nr:hypothetical protein F53441_5378 [Fusarium austroafricanum]
MTTNSFGSALPHFDFPQPTVKAITPRLIPQAARLFPTAAIVATGAAYYYTYFYAPRRQYHIWTNPIFEHKQPKHHVKDTRPDSQLSPMERMEEIGMWWTAM